jgi:hypothetical protein
MTLTQLSCVFEKKKYETEQLIIGDNTDYLFLCVITSNLRGNPPLVEWHIVHGTPFSR